MLTWQNLISSRVIRIKAYNILSKGKKKKRVEDVMPIATGHEREELEAGLEGRNILKMNYPVGPFGTKEAPAIVKSVYDKRIVGCPGGEGEDEHDVVWFWLEKGKPHECPVCSQYFMLKVVGPGRSPDGHGDDGHHWFSICKLAHLAPAIVKSVYDKRIVGCPGGEGEDEHDVVWFWLEKGKPHECPVCSQYFMLKVVGPGGPPDGHGDDGHH